MGGIIAHSQSVNSICAIEDTNGIFATGSSDKTIKMWKPSHQTLSHIQNDFWVKGNIGWYEKDQRRSVITIIYY